jgi:hypothetical protein
VLAGAVALGCSAVVVAAAAAAADVIPALEMH